MPIRLTCNIGNQEKIIWQNAVPSSARYCRPIRIRFVKETKDITNEEICYIEKQIRNLKKSEIPRTNGGIEIKHTLAFTMIDAKVWNAAKDTSSTMRCYICGQTSKDFNNLNKKNVANPDTLKFGLSTLHARIRFFEALGKQGLKSIKTWWQIERKIFKTLLKRKWDCWWIFPRQGLGTLMTGTLQEDFSRIPKPLPHYRS